MRHDKLIPLKTKEVRDAIVRGRLNVGDAINLVVLFMSLFIDEMENEEYMSERVELKFLDTARDKCMGILNSAWVDYFYTNTGEDENENQA